MITFIFHNTSQFDQLLDEPNLHSKEKFPVRIAILEVSLVDRSMLIDGWSLFPRSV
jgi:hypothetical protein